MALPTTADDVGSISDLFRLFEMRWTMPKPVIFRGEAREYDSFMCPSLFRDGASLSEFESYNRFYEGYLGSEERDYMFDQLHSNVTGTSLAVIALAQHYGERTRLLDVTLSPLVALFFAASTHLDSDGYIYFFCENFLDLSHHPADRDLIEIIEAEKIGDYKPTDDTLLYFRPEWPNARLAAQNGAFIFTKGFNQCVWTGGGTLRVPADRKQQILRQLDRFGVNRTTLFPV